jgi:hypothetical protein
MSGYGSFDGNRIKHLEMVQAVVSRLAGNSFLIKGWALTITGAFLGFAIDRDNSDLAVAALLPILVFWTLDTYYLRAERLFRALYDQVRSGDESIAPFFMGATSPDFVARLSEDTRSWRKTLWRLTLSGYYGVLLAATALVIAIICAG